MYTMCVCLFSALSRRVGALQISIIIIVISIAVVANIIVISVIVVTVVVVIIVIVIVNIIIIIIIDTAVAYSVNYPGREVSSFPRLKSTYYCYQHSNVPQDVPLMEFMYPG